MNKRSRAKVYSIVPHYSRGVSLAKYALTDAQIREVADRVRKRVSKLGPRARAILQCQGMIQIYVGSFERLSKKKCKKFLQKLLDER